MFEKLVDFLHFKALRDGLSRCGAEGGTTLVLPEVYDQDIFRRQKVQ